MGGTLGDCLTCFVWKHVEFLLAKVIYRWFFFVSGEFFFVGGGSHAIQMLDRSRASMMFVLTSFLFAVLHNR